MTSSIDVDAELQVLCDDDSSALREFGTKFHRFRDQLSAQERDYLDFIRRAADVAVAEHGKALIDDVDAFEASLEQILGPDYTAPTDGGIVIRTTVATRCATWLLRC